MNKETDKELLELAAKAAGYVFFEHTLINERTGFEYNGWNPLEDDSDAFRLAVHLEMLIDPVNRVVAGYSSDICIDIDPEEQEQEEDSCKAVRKAIVRAAAEIGKRMK